MSPQCQRHGAMGDNVANMMLAFEQDWNIVTTSTHSGGREPVHECDDDNGIGRRHPIIHHLLPNVRLKLESQRLRARLTLHELAEMISVSPQRVRMFEDGDVLPNAKEMSRIEEALQVKLSPVCDAIFVQ